MDRIGVGIIGYEPGRSWGAIAHAPALRALPDYRIVAVATSRRESAIAAAADLGLEKGYDDPYALIADPEVDLVAVTVKVPGHYALVKAAMDAGKHVFCEWPLALDLREATALADMARAALGRTAVGMQARMAPAIRQAGALISDGYVGEVLSTTMVTSGTQWGDVVDRVNAYIIDRANGATLLSIPLGHSIDALCHMLGEFTSLVATTAIRQPRVKVIETGEELTKTAFDQVAFSGELASGATAAIHSRGGNPRGTAFLWEIQGSEGDLRLTAEGGHAQIMETTLWGGRGDVRKLERIAPSPVHRWVPDTLSGPPLNVAQFYGLLARDIREGTKSCPDFSDAVVRHKLLESIERAAVSGERVFL